MLEWLIQFFSIMIILGLGVAFLEMYLLQRQLPRVYIVDDMDWYVVDMTTLTQDLEEAKSFFFDSPFKNRYLKRLQRGWGEEGKTFKFRNIQNMGTTVGLKGKVKFKVKK